MANTKPDSNNSQFMIMYKEARLFAGGAVIVMPRGFFVRRVTGMKHPGGSASCCPPLLRRVLSASGLCCLLASCVGMTSPPAATISLEISAPLIRGLNGKHQSFMTAPPEPQAPHLDRKHVVFGKLVCVPFLPPVTRCRLYSITSHTHNRRAIGKSRVLMRLR